MAHLLRDRAIWNRGGKQNGVLFPAKYLHQVLDERFKGRFSLPIKYFIRRENQLEMHESTVRKSAISPERNPGTEISQLNWHQSHLSSPSGNT